MQNQVIKYSYPLAKRSETRIQPNAPNSTCWVLSSSFVNSSLKHQPRWQTNNTRAQLDWINSGIYVSGCQSVKQDNFSQSNLLFKTKGNSHCQNFQLFTRYWSRPTYLPHTVITNLQWILRFGTSEYKKILIDIESQNNRITVRFRWFDHIITISLRDYWRVYRSRAMVYESKDHENDLMIPQVVFLSFEHPIFQETSPKLDSTPTSTDLNFLFWVHTSAKAK